MFETFGCPTIFWLPDGGAQLSYAYPPPLLSSPFHCHNNNDSVSLRISHIYLTPSYSNKVCPAHANMECVEPISLSHPPLTPTPPLYNDRQL